jgi:fibronectin type 3 domain-containing protein
MAHSAILSWTASVDAVAGYNVYRGTNPPGNEGATPINTSLITATTFTDTGVTAGEKVDYVVTAVSSSGVESVHSNEVSAVIPIAPPTSLAITVT